MSHNTQIADLTLNGWLQQKIKEPCHWLAGMDIADLARMDINVGGDVKTLADIVDPNTFENIRIEFLSKPSLPEIAVLIGQYYEEIGYVIQQEIGNYNAYCFVISDLEGELLVVTAAMDTQSTIVEIMVNETKKEYDKKG